MRGLELGPMARARKTFIHYIKSEHEPADLAPAGGLR